jgi:hypothetical protein
MSLTRAAVVVALVTVVGCSSSSSSNKSSTVSATTLPAAKAKFCADNAALTTAFSTVTSPDQFVTALNNNQATIADFASSAPSDIKAQAEVLVSAAQAAVAGNDATKFTTPAVAAAGTAVDTYCGQSTTTTLANTPPTTG